MAKTKKVVNRRARQPAKSRLPLPPLSQKAASKRGGRQTKYLSVRLLYSTRLELSLRRFRTNKAKRSKRNNQIVIPIPFLAVREISITKTKLRKRKLSGFPALAQQLKLTLALPVLIGALGVGYFGLHLYQPVNIRVKSTGHVLAASTAANTKTMPASAPTRLRIDKVGISAPVISLGLKTDGSLDTPPGPDEVGWYNGSPTPGQTGPAVIDGHVDWIDNIAVFWRLRELVPGDTFSVDRADGSTATFKVTAIQEFPQDNFPTQAVYGNINYAGIRLITCGGEFDTSTGHYNQNIVVFGSLI